MPGALAITIAEQASIIEAVLNTWAASQNSGVASFVSSLTDLWETPAINNDSFRILICYSGEKIKEGYQLGAILGRVDRAWIVRVTRGRGFSANRGDSLTKPVGNAIPFLNGVEICRDLIRGIQNICPEDELPVDFSRIEMRNTTKDGMTVDDAAIYFGNATQLPLLSATGTPPSNQVLPT